MGTTSQATGQGKTWAAAGLAALLVLCMQACGSRTGLFESVDDGVEPSSADASVEASAPRTRPLPTASPNHSTRANEMASGSLAVRAPATVGLGVRCVGGVCGPCEGDVRLDVKSATARTTVRRASSTAASRSRPGLRWPGHRRLRRRRHDVQRVLARKRRPRSLQRSRRRLRRHHRFELRKRLVQPPLLVLRSTASSPFCIDFPVTKGASARSTILHGRPGLMTIGNIVFSGTAQNSQVDLTGTSQGIGPDGCLWGFTRGVFRRKAHVLLFRSGSSRRTAVGAAGPMHGRPAASTSSGDSSEPLRSPPLGTPNVQGRAASVSELQRYGAAARASIRFTEDVDARFRSGAGTPRRCSTRGAASSAEVRSPRRST